MSREWTVRAQLTISQPAADQNSSVGDPRGSQSGVANSGDPQSQSGKPITIIYEWTTAADGATGTPSNDFHRGSHKTDGDHVIYRNSEAVRSQFNFLQ